MDNNSEQIKAIFDTVGEWWGYIVGLFGAVAVVVGVFRKHVWGIVKGVFAWCKAAAQLPTTLETIKGRLIMADGSHISDYVANIHRDVVGLRKMQETETFYRRELMSLSSERIFEANAQGSFLWANPAFLNASGVTSVEKICGESWRNIVLMKDRPALVDGWEQAVADGTHFKGKFRLNTITESWMEFDVTCNRDSIGNVLGFCGYMRSVDSPPGV